MQRSVSLILLLGGAAMLLTWLVSPAASSPQHQTAAVSQVATDRVASVNQVNDEVEGLRARLSDVTPFRSATRDPFTFGRRAEQAAPVLAPVAAPPAPAPRVLPKLIAILADHAGDSVRTAVFADDDDVHFVKSGEKTGGLLVTVIGSDGVTLSDESSGETFDVPLH